MSESGHQKKTEEIFRLFSNTLRLQSSRSGLSGIVELALQVVVGHGAYRGVGPDVFCGLDHVDDGVDRQDDAHEAHRSADGGHEGEGQEIAAHRDACIAYGSEDGDEEPGDHGAQRELIPGILHDEERGDENEGGAAVHIDGGADRQNETGDLRIDLQILFRAGQRDGQRAGGALREERHSQRRGHLTEYADRIQAAEHEDKRQHDEDLDGIAAENDEGVLAESAHDDARFDLCGELSCEGHDAHRQDEEQRADEGEEHFLRAHDDLQELRPVFRAGHEGQRKADGGGNDHDREDIAGNERLERVIRDDGQDVVVVGERFEIAQWHRRLAGSEKIHGQIIRCDHQIEAQADGSGADGGEQGVDDGMAEDAARVPVAPQLGQRGDHSQRDGRNGDELEQAGENGGHEVEQLIQRLNPHPAQNAAENECPEPERELPALIFRLILANGLLRGLPHIGRFVGIVHMYPPFL